MVHPLTPLVPFGPCYSAGADDIGFVVVAYVIDDGGNYLRLFL